MKIIYTAILFCSYYVTNAQTVLNYSFENVNTPPCAFNLPNATLNGQILDVTAFGTYGDCDVMSGTCGYGAPQQGNWFFALSVPPQPTTLSDAIAMKLSSPLIAGSTYQLSLYGKKDGGYASNPVEIGYSVNDISQGTVVDTVPAFASTTWTNYIITFTPTISAQYITLFAQPLTYGWNHIDNVQLQMVSGVNDFNNVNSQWNVFANSNQLQLNFYSVFKNALITVYDLQGKRVAEKNSGSTNKIFIDVSAFSSSFYFVKVKLDDTYESTKKILLIK